MAALTNQPVMDWRMLFTLLCKPLLDCAIQFLLHHLHCNFFPCQNSGSSSVVLHFKTHFATAATITHQPPQLKFNIEQLERCALFLESTFQKLDTKSSHNISKPSHYARHIKWQLYYSNFPNTPHFFQVNKISFVCKTFFIFHFRFLIKQFFLNFSNKTFPFLAIWEHQYFVCW